MSCTCQRSGTCCGESQCHLFLHISHVLQTLLLPTPDVCTCVLLEIVHFMYNIHEQEIVHICCVNVYRMYLCSSIHCTCILYSYILDERRVTLNTCLQAHVHASSAYVIGILTVLFIVTVGLKS